MTSDRPMQIGDWEPVSELYAELGYRLGDVDETQPPAQLVATLLRFVSESRAIRLRKQDTGVGPRP